MYGVAAIGVLILLVACFNFMNLSTARAQLRAREIALRKTMGASRRQIVIQFLSEAVVIALLSLVLALAAVELLLPGFDSFMQAPLGFDYATDWLLLLALIAVAVLAGLVSGFYPALVLSAYRPAATLRTNSSGQAGSGTLRNILVIFQFAVSIGLGIGAAVVFSQIEYARNIDLGFRHDNVVAIDQGRLNIEERAAFARALRNYPGIAQVGETDRPPFQIGQSMSLVRVPGQSEDVLLNGVGIDPDFPKVYDIKLVAGRYFSQDRADDRMHSNMPMPDPLNAGRNIIINAAAAQRLGFTPEKIVGKTVIFNQNPAHIVGVLADTKIQGAREPVKPSVYVYIPNRRGSSRCGYARI